MDTSDHPWWSIKEAQKEGTFATVAHPSRLSIETEGQTAILDECWLERMEYSGDYFVCFTLKTPDRLERFPYLYPPKETTQFCRQDSSRRTVYSFELPRGELKSNEITVAFGDSKTMSDHVKAKSKLELVTISWDASSLAARTWQRQISEFTKVLIDICICSVEWFVGIFPISLLLIGLLVFSFWNDWTTLRTLLSKSWLLMACPAATVVHGAIWIVWARNCPNGQRDIQGWAGNAVFLPLWLFIVSWILLFWHLKQPLNRQTLSLFLLEGWITLVVSFTVGLICR